MEYICQEEKTKIFLACRCPFPVSRFPFPVSRFLFPILTFVILFSGNKSHNLFAARHGTAQNATPLQKY